MKKIFYAVLFVAAIAVSACHYGENEAKQTLDRNELYKSEKQDYSVNHAGEGGKHEKTDASASSATNAETTVDAPAEEAHN